MALVPKLPNINQKRNDADDLQLFPKCGEQTNKNIKYSFKETNEKPYVNMNAVKWLIDVQDNCDSDEAHEIFMSNYKKIFQKDEQIGSNKKKSAVPSMVEREKEAKMLQKANEKAAQIEDKGAYEIGNYLEQIHGKKAEIIDPHLKKLMLIKNLRKILKTLPFERREQDNKKIFKYLQKLGSFKAILPNVPDYTLQKLCSYATLEVVSGKGTPVFGNFGFYVILKGAVKPLSEPYLNVPGARLRPTTPEPSEEIELSIGEEFGTLQELKNRDITTRMLRVLAVEESCEFLKIGINDYSKIIEKIKVEKHDEKMNLIKNCAAYKAWPKHAIEDLITILEWLPFRENTILTTEGYRSPFIGFIEKGTCHVLRKVDVIRKNQEGKDVKHMKQVVIGKLNEHESFGEISVILKEPMTCSIVTETECRIGVIHFEKIFRLDDITQRLLMHANKRNFSELTQDDLHKQYIDQELKKEWIEFKNSIVDDIVDKYGVNYNKV